MEEKIFIDELFQSKAHYFQSKDEVVNMLIYEIAKKIDTEGNLKKVFTYSIDLSNKRVRYIQLKCYRVLKKLYGIKGFRSLKDTNKIHLTLEF